MSSANYGVKVFSDSGKAEDEATCTLPPLYQGTDWTVRGSKGDFHYRFSIVGDDLMSLRQSVADGSITGDVAPGDDYVVQWLARGSSVVDIGREPVPQRPGRPVLLPPHRSFVFSFDDFDQRLVHFNRAAVDALAFERFGIPPGTAEFDHTRSASVAAAERWHGAVTRIVRGLKSPGTTPLVWSELRTSAMSAFLDLCPPRASTVTTDAKEIGNDGLRRAVEYVGAHAAEPLTTADIARELGVSSRSVQASFQHGLDTTPLAFIRQVRLERAHAELRAADPQETSVAEVASRWGFAHLGRFASAYRSLFGEQPRRTLQR